MFNRFTRDARAVVGQAQREAKTAGSPTVEAEHLLLALAGRGDPVLTVAGLDHDAVREALAAETAHSLAVVGIAWDEPARATTATAPSFATSAKLALERSMRAALDRGDTRITASHVLLGVLRAEVGTVPRALRLAEIDRVELLARGGAAASDRGS